MKVSARGQITIPKAIRTASGVLPGSEVRVTHQGETIIVQKVSGVSKIDRRSELRKVAARAQKSIRSDFQQIGGDEITSFMRG